MLTKGDQVGNYAVEEEIGGGGMARLYRVRHVVLGTLHALKVLEPTFRRNAEVRERFLSEAMIGVRLSHPNIVRVSDAVSTPEVAGIVMELVRGPNLEQHIRGLSAMPSADEVRALFVPVLDAVGFAHAKGIVHRDLKPANILLEPDGAGHRPKVTDFGIAKVTEAAEIVQKKGSTRADARMGTLAYMSPEQIRRAREVTARSDIFSLGATLYELATRTVAFSGDSEYEVMHQIVNGRYEAPENMPGMDPAIAAAITRALQPEPEDRFSSCAEFADAVRAPSRRSASEKAARQPAVLVELPSEVEPPPRDAPEEPARPSAEKAAPRRVPSGQEAAPAAPARPIVVPSPSGASSSSSTGYVNRRTGDSRLRLLFAAGVLLLLGGLAAMGLTQDSPKQGNSLERRPEGPSPVTPPAGPRPYDGCLKSRIPTRVAVTCLSPERSFRDVDEIRSWFPGLAGWMVEVVKLERKKGGRRLVCFELSQNRWPRWRSVVGDATGEELCQRIGVALNESKIGRPVEQRLNGNGTAFEYDVFDVRSPDKYRSEPLGDLDYALGPTGLNDMTAWLRGE